VETLPTSRFRALVAELGAEPSTHFDSLSPRALWTFLSGYVLVVPSFRSVLARVDERAAKEHRTRLTLSAGTLHYLDLGDSSAGYRALLQRVTAALPTTETVTEAEPPLVRTFRHLLPTLQERPTVLLGSRDVKDWAIFVRGLHRGLIDRGVDPAHDRALLGMYERSLQQRYGLPSRWDLLLDVWDLGRGESAVEFARSFEAWYRDRQSDEARS
jgi:hypothetical protein